LAVALKPAAPPTRPTTVTPPLAEAQQSLVEAELALRKAAASIGALEEVFATALNKPAAATETPLLLTVDGLKLKPVQEACQTVAAQLNAAAATKVASPLTVAQYQAAYQQAIAAANEASVALAVQLQWLREQLASGALSISARVVHYYVADILQSLAQGVMRV